MTYQDILRHQPWLTLINRHNVSDRLLEVSRGDLFVVFNHIHQTYEVHSVESYKINGYSQNATIENNMVNGFLVNDYKATNLKEHGEELSSYRDKTNRLYDKHEEKRFDTSRLLKSIERTLGTKL